MNLSLSIMIAKRLKILLIGGWTSGLVFFFLSGCDAICVELSRMLAFHFYSPLCWVAVCLLLRVFGVCNSIHKSNLSSYSIDVFQTATFQSRASSLNLFVLTFSWNSRSFCCPLYPSIYSQGSSESISFCLLI